MKVSNQALDEFKKIYHEENGVKLTDEEANEIASKLLALVQSIINS